MAKHYLVTKIVAYGFCEQGENPAAQENVLKKVLATSRRFGDGLLCIQPVFIHKGKKSRVNWCQEAFEEQAACSCFGLYYQITVNDDTISQSNLLDAIYASISLMEYYEEEIFLIPLDPVQIPSNRILETNEALEIYSNSLPYTAGSLDNDYIFRSQSSRGFSFDQRLWEIVSRVMAEEQIIYASLFLKTSYAEFQFLGDDVTDVMINHEEVPQYINEAVRLENSIHNCYKVIEAIYGGTLSTSQKKVKKKFESIGIDTNIKVGYERYGFVKQKIIEKIYALQYARNDRAAHGRIHENRKNTFYELMDYQALANCLLILFVKKKFLSLEGII